MNLQISIGGKSLQNPVGVASGTFGYGSEYEKLIDLSRLGAIYTKAVTLAPREGNEVPRIVETPSGILELDRPRQCGRGKVPEREAAAAFRPPVRDHRQRGGRNRGRVRRGGGPA